MPTDDEMVKVLKLYSMVELTLEVGGGKRCQLYSVTGSEQGVSMSVKALYNDLHQSMLHKVKLIESEY